MSDIERIADEADMIVNGYAFKTCPKGYQIINLNNLNKALVLSKEGEPLETSMDDIEIYIVKEYFEKNRKLLEVC